MKVRAVVPSILQTGVIIISEAIYLIWKLRCEWRIQRNSDPNALHFAKEITNRWIHTINLRLPFDCLLTNKIHYGPKTLDVAVVHRTWTSTLHDEPHLPDNWHQNTGVLVGMGVELQNPRAPHCASWPACINAFPRGGLTRLDTGGATPPSILARSVRSLLLLVSFLTAPPKKKPPQCLSPVFD